MRTFINGKKNMDSNLKILQNGPSRRGDGWSTMCWASYKWAEGPEDWAYRPS